ncbi:MAG: Phosphatidylglycerophosphatase A [Verrucomicrobia bacterium ADurb.Bin474]|nr:MAG: Phosphatidylglycerophosphatase A [Verrucomicrobia bacterium ADurb.Bin474]
MPFCFIGFDRIFGEIPAWPYVLLGFIVFRVLDISKPLFIGRLDRIEGGFGIVADDVASGLVTCLILHAVHLQGWFDRWIGLS